MAQAWKILDSETHTLTAEYEFRPGSKARTLATRFHGDELVVMSPPVGFGDEEYEQLAKHGKVTAIVAPNGFHYLGVRGTLEAFPEATVYAPSGASARISKKKLGFEMKPLAELASRATGDARILDVPGFSIGETWVTVSTASGPIWYVSDSCMNMLEVPGGVAGLLLKWTGSAPGLKLNGLGNMFFLKDKPGYRNWFEAELERGAPSVLVPGHGAVYTDVDLAQGLRGLLEARL